MRQALFALLLLSGVSAPALAQQAPAGLDGRVNKLEKEMRAVQRKVFPGSNPQYFEPEITAPSASADPAGIPASSPIADLSSRVDALEKEFARLTGQVEQNGFKLRQLEDMLTKMKGDTEFRLNTLEGGAPPPVPGAAPGAPLVAPPAAKPAPAPAAKPVPTPAPVAATPAPAPAPAGAVKTDPASSDPGEDAYMAGYRLWEAKRYGEAATKLKDVVAKYPKHKRASYAQNLIGRSYLDDGKPAMAAEAFYANYQKMPRGERAPDSLYYLGQSLVQLKKPAEACKVYDELEDVYGATLSTALRDRVAKGRVDAKCK